MTLCSDLSTRQPSTGPSRLPLLPPRLLKRHSAFITTDTRFRAAARLLQSLHRVDAGLAVGTHLSITGDKRRRILLGSRLTPAAAEAGQNFISTEVHRLVRRELVLREEGALIDEDRLYGNMLSSMPLTFNFLGLMALDLGLATVVWRHLLPAFIDSVTAIGFEHAPGRGQAAFLADGTAFDAALQVVTPNGEPGMVYVEFKYSEGMTGPAAAHRPRYDEASRAVALYRDPDSAALRGVAMEQFWREHMVAQLAVDLGVTPRAHFVAIGPHLNRQVGAALGVYAAELTAPTPTDGDRVGFTALTLEAVVDALAAAGATDLAEKLRHRYLDFGRVLALALAEADGLAPTPPRPAPSRVRKGAMTVTPAPQGTAERQTPPQRRTRERLPGQRRRRAAADAVSSSPGATRGAAGQRPSDGGRGRPRPPPRGEAVHAGRQRHLAPDGARPGRP